MLSFLLCRARDLVISGAYMQALVVKQSVNGFAACLVSDVADIARAHDAWVDRVPHQHHGCRRNGLYYSHIPGEVTRFCRRTAV